jgi:hypothetical protein
MLSNQRAIYIEVGTSSATEEAEDEEKSRGCEHRLTEARLFPRPPLAIHRCVSNVIVLIFVSFERFMMRRKMHVSGMQGH